MLLLIVSCDNKRERNSVSVRAHDTPDDDFFPKYAGGDIKPDTLYLYTMLDDCGEWGGPRDEYKIYVDAANQYRLDFKRFKFNCDSIGYYNSLDRLPLETQKNLVLGTKSKHVVSQYCMQLIKAKIKEKVNSNAGSFYLIRSVDSTLNVRVHSEKQEIKASYLEFKRKLGLRNLNTILKKE